jgi:hypothetical protein
VKILPNFSLREMTFSEYEEWLAEQTSGVLLDPRCVQIGPYATPTVAPNKPPWKLEWTVLFEDGFYFRVVENWYRRTASLGGRGYRKAFSFHYGPTNPAKDGEGVPLHSENYRAIIRIDQDADWRGPHIHFDGEDHIPQGKVKNLRISDVDPFHFIQAVIEHRQSGDNFDKILRFTVIK